MREVRSFLLLAVLAAPLVFTSSARAGVTIDVVFQDGTGTALTIAAGSVGPGCEFGGYYGGSTSTGRCMDVVMHSTEEVNALSVSVAYDSDNGLAVGSTEGSWSLYGYTFPMRPSAGCHPGDVADNGGMLQSFRCVLDDPTGWLEPGTYRIGTIIWDTSGTSVGEETIAAYIDSQVDGFLVWRNGSRVDISSEVVLNGAVLRIIPEPGTAALVGLGLTGLVLAARRHRPPQR